MRRKGWTAILLMICMLSVGTIPATAAEEKASVKFSVESVTEDGRFDLKLAIYNAQFNAFQFAIRFDPAVLQPLDAKTGKETDEFSSFASYGEDTTWMATVGTAVDAGKGFLKFTGYVTPGAVSDEVNEDRNVVAGDGGVEVFVFHFRKKTDAQPRFWLATEKGGEPYDHSLPDGAGLVMGGQDVPASIDFLYPTGEGKDESTSMPSIGSSGQSQSGMTRAQRVKDTVIFQIGNASAAVGGKLTAIYPDEPTVTVYAHDERTFIPIRFLAENLGAEVGWDNATQTVSIEKNGHKVLMQVGKTSYTVDGKEMILDVPAEFKGEPGSANQRTMVPVRFVAEALGMDVKWDKANNAVIVSPKDAPWNLDGVTEKQLMSDTLLMLSPLVQGVVG